MTPRQSIERECHRRGRDQVIAGCRRLLRGKDVDGELLFALGGPGAGKFLDGQPHDDVYWLRVWGARGLLWAWGDEAAPELGLALNDESWRVREMALKVIARHELDQFVDDVAALRRDHVVRVRQAADRALARLTAGGDSA